MSDVAIVCLTVVPATYALALVALVRWESRLPRQSIRAGRDVAVMTDARTVTAGTDAPRAAVTSQGVYPAELLSPSRRAIGGPR
jgi:hypothetical protein